MSGGGGAGVGGRGWGRDVHAPMRVALYSRAGGGREPRVMRGAHDVLVDNDPFNREYHLAVCGAGGRVLYDMPARCEPRGAIAVPLDPDGRVALVRQWRPVPPAHPADSEYPLRERNLSTRGFWSLELPRGFPEPDESGADAARRETREETGLTPVRVWPLGWINFNTSIMLSDQPIFAVLVDATLPDKRDHYEDGECIAAVEWFAQADLRALVTSGSIRCGITLSALSYVFAAEGTLHSVLRVRDAVRPVLNRLPAKLPTLPAFLEACWTQLWEAGVDMRDLRLDSACYQAESEAAFHAVATAMDAQFSRPSTFLGGSSAVLGPRIGAWDIGKRDALELSGFTVRRMLVSVASPAASAPRSGWVGLCLATEQPSARLLERYPKLHWESDMPENVVRFSVRDAHVTVFSHHRN